MEIWDILDKNGTVIGRCNKGEVPNGRYHAVVHLWMRNGEGKFLLSQRAEGKHHPLLWETTGGSVLAGETAEDAARREAMEELGVRVEGLVPFLRFCQGDQIVTVFVTFYSGTDITLRDGETIGWKYASEGELRQMNAKGECMPFTYEESLFAWLSIE
ncbi:MAG: NUDIX domain-containing protein [Clostridia bacterium]|nr:NUDIX domain-containing protein [Clostridia bacterium]